MVVPTYNEKNNLSSLVGALDRNLKSYEVVIVDDSSPDGTAGLARELGKKFPVRVITRKRRGLSGAVIEGIRKSKAGTICVMDADMQHPPNAIPGLLKKMKESKADILVASRYKNGKIEGWSLSRLIISKTATGLAKLVLPEARQVEDPLSGFFLVRKGVIRPGMKPVGYKILLEVLVKGNYVKIVEVPYVFGNRKSGSSKLDSRQVLQFARHLLKLRRERND